MSATLWAALGEVRWKTPDGVVHRAYAPEEIGTFCTMKVGKFVEESLWYQGKVGEAVSMRTRVTCVECRKFGPEGWDSLALVDLEAATMEDIRRLGRRK